MKKKQMAACLLALLTLGGFSAGAESVTMLDEIIVEADRDGDVVSLPGGLVNQTAREGIIGNQSVMDIPWSEMSMTKKNLETFSDPSQPLALALASNPSIRSSTSSPMYTDFSMRGINMNGNHMMLNGIPSMYYQFNGPPAHIIERMDITSGPNAAVNGVSMSNNGTNSGATPAPGTINIVTKKAGDEPITRFTESFSGRGNFAEFIDVARRTGKNNEWGIRVLGEHMKGELSLRNAEKNERNIFINVDRRGKTSTTNIFSGAYDLRVNKAQRWFTFGGRSAELPHAPDSDTDYDFDGTTKWMYGWVLTVNHEKQINHDWAWFTNWGINRRSGNKYNSSANLKFDEKGNFMPDNVSNAQNESGTNSYFQTGIKGKVRTGQIEHQLAFSLDRSGAKYWNDTHNSKKGTIIGNLYDGVAYTPDFAIPALRKRVLSWEELNTGITVADAMRYGKWNVLLAASRKHERFINRIKHQRIQNNNWLPAYGITYRASDDFSVYASRTESLSRGAVVSGDKYINNGDTLSPSRSKQTEAGIKYKTGGILTTLSYFDIDTQSLIDKEVNNGKYWRGSDGRDRYKGVEWTINGKISPKLTATGGFMYLNAKREKTKGGSHDGKYVNGSAKWSGVLGLVYAPSEKVDLIGRYTWVGKAYIDNDKSPTKSTKIPSYGTLDLGTRYHGTIQERPLTLSLMCYNVFGKDYWMGRGGSTTFGLSMPRTWMLSCSLDF